MSTAKGSKSESQHGLLLIAHGTDDPRGTASTRQVASQVEAHWEGPLSVGFLEKSSPTVTEAIEECSRRGVTSLTVVPLLLFSAGHAKRDIPHLLGEAQEKWPELTIHVAKPLGCHPDVIELSALRYEQALFLAGQEGEANHPRQDRDREKHDSDPVADVPTLLILVGRGSHDPEATDHMARFAQLRRQRTPVDGCEVAYLAMASPRLNAILEQGMRCEYPRVVVQPHLLFAGQLTQRISVQLREARARAPEKQWIETPPLGADPRLIAALLKRAEEAEKTDLAVSSRNILARDP
jgi:sirohydrochlorin ferrochelatase